MFKIYGICGKMSVDEDILYELKKIGKSLEHIEVLLEERLIGIDNPLQDEKETEKYFKERSRKLEPANLKTIEIMG